MSSDLQRTPRVVEGLQTSVEGMKNGGAVLDVGERDLIGSSVHSSTIFPL